MGTKDLNPILWTRKEAAKQLCCSIVTIDRLIRNGKLKTVFEFEEGKNSTQLFIVANVSVLIN
jgi:hypothetical protein